MNFQVYFLARRSDYIFLCFYQMFFHWLLDGSSGDHLVLQTAQSRVSHSRLYCTMPSWFKISAWMENFTASRGNLCQCWNILTWQRKLLNGISCFSLSPLPLVLSMDNKEKSLNPFFPCPPFKFYTGKTPTDPYFLQAKYSHIPQLILGRCSKPLIMLVAFFRLTLVFCTWNSRTGHSAPDVPPQGWAEDKNLLAVFCLLKPGKLMTFFSERSHCWLILSLASFRTHSCFPAGSLNILVHGVVPVQFQNFVLPFPLQEGLGSPLSQLVKVPGWKHNI